MCAGRIVPAGLHLQAQRSSEKGAQTGAGLLRVFRHHRGSLRRLGLQQLALGQLHWSVAKYAPPLERALWDGLAAMYDEVCHVSSKRF